MVTSFSFSTNIDYDVIYGVNSILPLQVSIKYPIQVSVDFTLEVDDYQTKRMTNMLVTGAADPFTVQVFGTVFEDEPLYTATFTLNLVGSTLASGISYQWQYSAAGANTWFNLPELASMISVDCSSSCKT